MTAEGANAGDAWRHCKHCAGPGSHQRASQLEQTTLLLLRRAAGDALWATESRLLGGTHGASDFIWDLRPGPESTPAERHWAIVEADGSQHFDRPRNYTPQAERRRIDKEKDAAAWAKGWPVLRLHHADTPDLPDLLAAAKYYGRHPRVHTFILYTDSYNLPSLGLLTDGRTVALDWRQVGRGRGGWLLTV